MKHSKQELEEFISKTKTLGVYVFDEEKQHFTSDVEIGLVIRKVKENLYKPVSYFFDGYEVWVEDEINLFFEGNEDEATQKAIESWLNSELEFFMSYPIIYTNVSCEIYCEPK
ncbi:hypothetical protein WAF17_17665 [Bernardetia sp. ABR2-2B]|uniref:hypothetical protein n=1 Tax=Bernardetia sp. ABR2-2B TaxID=3127472 RepID=UPI0030CDA4AF